MRRRRTGPRGAFDPQRFHSPPASFKTVLAGGEQVHQPLGYPSGARQSEDSRRVRER